MSDTPAKRELQLESNTYAYIQDSTKGVIRTYTGPSVVVPTQQDIPIVYNDKKGVFEKCGSFEECKRVFPVAVEGYYLVLLNPSAKGLHPEAGRNQDSSDLSIGRKVHIQGPATFALWPGQKATVIKGHSLRSNQFLLCKVYNEEEARKNWGNAVVKATSKLIPPAEGASDEEKKTYETAKAAEEKAFEDARRAPEDLADGMLFIIKGTDVSFYIPPTGITVVSDGEADGRAVYTREALTLERLEYSILVDENGRKRYEYGPQVVFPEPTEKFLQSKSDSKDERSEPAKKFRAIELNEIQGIHVKVIANYEEKGKEFKAGDELFITGKEQAIYYPREEHSIVKYDGKTKHFATAVPEGEARYVLNRMTGEIKTVKGPVMLLCDPRTEIIVRRVLSDKQAQLWYPGNTEVLQYNQELRKMLAQAPTTRTGTLSEGDVMRGAKRGQGGRTSTDAMFSMANAAAPQQLIGSSHMYGSTGPAMMESSSVSKEQDVAGQEFSRSSTYNSPRTLTLDSKLQGVPTIELWTNYGIMVVSKSGERRVEVGPTAILLEYDESLEVLELSTGKPKTTDNLIKTVFLRVENNKVADFVKVETLDHVSVELRLSYLVNFEGDKNKWFAVENYVKFLCDHVRSVLKGAVKKIRIEEFYNNSTDLIRSILLSEDKKGMLFEANSMRLSDVEVLGVQIMDEQIRRLLDSSQLQVVQTNIEMSNLKRGLEVTEEKALIDREGSQIHAETVKMKNELEKELLVSSLALTLARLGNVLTEFAEQKKVSEGKFELALKETQSKVDIEEMLGKRRLDQNQAEQNQRIEFLKAEAEATISKFKAVEGNFTSALLALSNNETLIKAAEAWSFQKVVGGENITDALTKVFAGSPLANIVKQITANGAPIEAKVSSKPQATV